jgi:hypothetical protein
MLISLGQSIGSMLNSLLRDGYIELELSVDVILNLKLCSTSQS